VDRLDIEENFAAELKKAPNRKLVLLCNLTEANRHADIVVNAIIGDKFGSKLRNRSFLDESTNTRFFFGPKYLIFKNDFHLFKQQQKIPQANIRNILVIFGGSDPSNLTTATLRELMSMDNDVNVEIVLGAHYEFFNELNQALEEFGDKKKNVMIFRDVENVAEIMFRADLVLASPGISVFEALCVGTPVVVIHQNLWQKTGFEGFVRTLDKSEINQLSKIIASKHFIDPRDNEIDALKIGEGKNELWEEIFREMKL
jgi:UDP-2,4-diacetamido-2,4,6-trideoxy-beta-L-altropyranose hydrolase